MEAESASRPKTIVGQWLLAMIFGRKDQRDKLLARLNGGDLKSKWTRFDELATADAACRLAIRRLLLLDADMSLISAVAKDMVEKNVADKVPSQAVTETVILGALGRDVDMRTIPNLTRFVAQGYAVAYVYHVKGMTDKDLAGLIADAEQIAFGHGWNPPLAE